MKSLISAIVTLYNTIAYDDDNDLHTLCPIYFGVAPDDAEYPFCCMSLVTTNIAYITTCDDVYNYFVQFSVYDNLDSPSRVLAYGDLIKHAYNRPSMTVSDNLIQTDLRDCTCRQIDDKSGVNGHVYIVTYSFKVAETIDD